MILFRGIKVELLFVYGTLRKSGVNHTILEEAESIAKQAWTTGKLYYTNWYFPAFKKSNTRHLVYGELYKVTKQQLLTLDVQLKVEANRSEAVYIRTKQVIYTEEGMMTANIYIYNQICKYRYPIPHGDWKFDSFLHKTKETFLFFDYEKSPILSDYREKTIGFAQGYSLEILSGYPHLKEKKGSLVEGRLIRLPSDALSELMMNYQFFQNIYRPAFVDVSIEGEYVTDVLTFILNEPSIYQHDELLIDSSYLNVKGTVL